MNTYSLHKFLIYIVICSGAIFIVYYPGLSGGFLFDDISNILRPSGVAMHELTWDSLKGAALSMNHRPIALASFGLNHLAAGFNPYYFKVVNIVIHIINALLVFAVIQRILSYILGENPAEDKRSTFIAAAVSLAWALHPVNLTNVLYIVQRMNSLSALFVLAGMLSYIKGRTSLEVAPLKGWLLIAASIALFLPLAWFSKENGALLPLFLFLVEVTIFRFRDLNTRHRKGLYLFHIIFVVLPSLLALLYLLQNSGMFQTGYSNRHFSMTERLLTEPRVLWLYIRMIILPSPSVFGLFHDDIAISTSFTTPISTIFSIIGLAGLLVVAILSLKPAPILAFGLLFFFTGHLIESSFIPLELAFEHRNYLPSIGLLLPVFYYLGYGFEPNKYLIIRFSVMTTFILLLAFQTHFRTWSWSDNVRLYLSEVQYHPYSPRANYEAGKVYGQRLERGFGDPDINYRAALEHFNRVTSLRENTTSGLFGNIMASIDSNKEIQSHWIQELEYRLSTQPLEQVNLVWLDRITDCISQSMCNKEDMQVPRLIKSAIGNQHANTTIKAMLSSILAKYAYQVEIDEDETLNMAREAVSIMPTNMYYQINLVRYLIWAKHYNEARTVLSTIKIKDINNQHNAEIIGLSQTLENR